MSIPTSVDIPDAFRRALDERLAALQAGATPPTMRVQVRMDTVEAVIWQAAMVLSGRRRVLTYGNPKLAKSERWANVGLTLSPWKEARLVIKGYNACLFARNCQLPCVGKSGQGKLTSSQIARIGRSLALAYDLDAFVSRVLDELGRVRRRYAGKRRVAFRANVASDFAELAALIASLAPEVSLYDYTADPSSVRLNDGVVRALSCKTYRCHRHLDTIRDALDEGYPATVVFDITKHDAKPATFLGYPVVDGDVDDTWFDHPDRPASGGYVVGLYLKGHTAEKQDARRSGFAVPTDHPLCTEG